MPRRLNFELAVIMIRSGPPQLFNTEPRPQSTPLLETWFPNAAGSLRGRGNKPYTREIVSRGSGDEKLKPIIVKKATAPLLAIAVGVCGAALVIALLAVGTARMNEMWQATVCRALADRLQAGVVADLPAEPEGFVILGGGLHAYQFGDGGPGERISAALALAEQFPRATFIYTGAREAAAVGAIFADKGVQAPVLLDGRATTTFENAQEVSRMIGARRARPWVLITSAWHMKRALATFKAQGFKVHAYPVDALQARRDGWCGMALRETLAFLFYGLRGRF